jgi:hypothetical protein
MLQLRVGVGRHISPDSKQDLNALGFPILTKSSSQSGSHKFVVQPQPIPLQSLQYLARGIDASLGTRSKDNPQGSKKWDAHCLRGATSIPIIYDCGCAAFLR